jgi:hypothetical protein
MSEVLSKWSRRLPVLTAVAGLVVLAITLAFGRLPAVQAAGECWTPDAVFLFEFATTQEQVLGIFGPKFDPCYAPNLAAMDAVNTLDVFAYIPAYTAFTCLAALYFAGSTRRIRALAIGLALAAAIADYVETPVLLAITRDLDAATAAQMLTASTAAWVKFGSLAAHAAVLGVACFIGTPRRVVLGPLLALPLIGFAAMAVDFDLYDLLKLAFVASWTALLMAAGWETLRGFFRHSRDDGGPPASSDGSPPPRG